MNGEPVADSLLLGKVVLPALAQAEQAFSAALASINVEELTRSAAAVGTSPNQA